MRPLPAEDFIRHGTPAFRRANLALFAAGIATFGLLYCVQPLMPEFSRRYGVSAAASALSLSLPTGVMAVALLFAGAVSDARGRKGIMAASTLCSALLTLLTAVAPGWFALLTLRALLGLTLAGLPAIAMTYLSEEVHAESIGLGMGLYIGGSAVGGLGGRLLTGIVADFFGWRWAMAAMGAVGLVCALVFSRSLPPSRRFVPQPLELDVLMRRFAGTFSDPGLPWLFAEGFVLLGAVRHPLQLHRLSPDGGSLRAEPVRGGALVQRLPGRHVQLDLHRASRRPARKAQGAVDHVRHHARRLGVDHGRFAGADHLWASP